MQDGLSRLSPREKKVLEMVLDGKRSREVADELCVSKRTVDFHLGRAYKKLKVANRVQAFKAINGNLKIVPDDA